MANNIPNQIQTAPKPTSVVSTNRPPDNIALASGSRTNTTDPVVSALEGDNSGLKGSYSNPKVIRFPVDISSGQYPHVMQFKAYWRWERKDLADERAKAVADSNEQINQLEAMKERLERGEVPATIASRLALGGPDVPYEALTQDTAAAKRLLEERIKSEQTKLEELNSIGKVSLDTDETLQVQDRVGNSIANFSVAESAASAGILAASGAAGFSLLTGGSGKDALKSAGIAGLVAAGGVAGLAVLAKVGQNQPVYDQMISMYLPFCTKINTEDMFVYEDTGGTAVLRGLMDAGSGIDSAIDAGAQGVVAGAQQIGGGVGTAVGLAGGLVINPRLEKLFKQKEMRNFTFSWELYPRNEDEITAIQELINTFRYHAHPAKDETVIGDEPSNTQINLRVPAEFTVRFMSYTKNGETSSFQDNPYIPKISRCVINQISADFTPNSVFSSFKNNAPTAVTLTISMSEVTAMTREIVERGF